jgi:branched-chain amino acid transport system permease protein
MSKSITDRAVRWRQVAVDWLGPANLYVVVGSVGLLLLVPLVVQNAYAIHLIDNLGIAVILAISLHTVTGLAGQISIGHAAFYGIGAYSSAMLTLYLGWPFWIALPTSGLVTAASGLLLGIPSIRIRSHYLALVTIAFGEIVNLVLVNSVPQTGGVDGLRPPVPSLFGFSFDDNWRFYYIILVAAILAFVSVWRVQSSGYGLSLQAMRDDESAAASLGLNAVRLKLTAFVLSAFYAGIAGSLFGHFMNYISPDSFTISTSILFLVMIVVGGIGRLSGALIGAVVVTFLPEGLRVIGDYDQIVYGSLLILFMVLFPGGLVGLIRLASRGLRRQHRQSEGG